MFLYFKLPMTMAWYDHITFGQVVVSFVIIFCIIILAITVKDLQKKYIKEAFADASQQNSQKDGKKTCARKPNAQSTSVTSGLGSSPPVVPPVPRDSATMTLINPKELKNFANNASYMDRLRIAFTRYPPKDIEKYSVEELMEAIRAYPPMFGMPKQTVDAHDSMTGYTSIKSTHPKDGSGMQLFESANASLWAYASDIASFGDKDMLKLLLVIEGFIAFLHVECGFEFGFVEYEHTARISRGLKTSRIALYINHANSYCVYRGGGCGGSAGWFHVSDDNDLFFADLGVAPGYPMGFGTYHLVAHELFHGFQSCVYNQGSAEFDWQGHHEGTADAMAALYNIYLGLPGGLKTPHIENAFIMDSRSKDIRTIHANYDKSWYWIRLVDKVGHKVTGRYFSDATIPGSRFNCLQRLALAADLGSIANLMITWCTIQHDDLRNLEPGKRQKNCDSVITRQTRGPVNALFQYFAFYHVYVADDIQQLTINFNHDAANYPQPALNHIIHNGNVMQGKISYTLDNVDAGSVISVTCSLDNKVHPPRMYEAGVVMFLRVSKA